MQAGVFTVEGDLFVCYSHNGAAQLPRNKDAEDQGGMATMRFVADAMLGRLAKWLRLLGYDTLYWRGGDAGLVRLVLAENRLLLTRDTHLPPRLPPHLICFIDSDHYDAQLGQVVARFGLPPRIGRLCLRCNLPLEPADKAGLQGEIPEFVWQTQERFARCPGCLRIYWEGTHYARMLETLDRVAVMKKENAQCA